MKKFSKSLIFKLFVAIALGLVIGLFASEPVINVINTIKYVLGQIIFFAVPLIIIGFIAPSIAQLKSNASKLLGYALLASYLSSIGAAFMSTFAGYAIIPKLNIVNNTEGLKKLPEIIFKLEIPPIMPVMSALFFSIFVGLATAWTGSELTEKLLVEFQNIVLEIVNKVIIPIIPLFTASTFATLAYQGSITTLLPVFIKAIVIVLIGHFIWIAVLYLIAGAMSGKNPMKVLKYYGPAYVTAVGTMSSAATLPVALKCAKKSDILRDDITDFTIPLCANIHLCGSALSEAFIVMTVSQVLYGKMPSVSTMVLFVLLLGIFAVGAPGVPGGVVMASLGIVTSVLGFNDAGTALLITIYALQDSFGTACNVTGGGAIALILTGIANKKGL
ncbi:MAG TPA: dicarboxylate/amino acid:cation symporter [Clostridiaceae bacterium]|jgi:Na+/H+-dicarboxylate symporter|nr:dicarboxylate/amino acid:cation symporter [Clostridiaceae bacterium]